MKRLTNVEEVHALAFSSEELVNKGVITSSDIDEAERRYIYPILGEALYNAIADGSYAALRTDFVLPAVAAWCRYVVQPVISLRCQECHGDSRTTAQNDHLRELLRHLRRKASTLSRCLSDHLNSHGNDYAEYNPRTNPLNRCSIDGNIIQVY